MGCSTLGYAADMSSQPYSTLHVHSAFAAFILDYATQFYELCHRCMLLQILYKSCALPKSLIQLRLKSMSVLCTKHCMPYNATWQPIGLQFQYCAVRNADNCSKTTAAAHDQGYVNRHATDKAHRQQQLSLASPVLHELLR